MKKVFIWASVHKPTTEQLENLISREKSRVVFLSNLNKDLFNEIIDLKKDSDLDQISRELVNVVRNNFIDEKAILVQPSGNPALHVHVGMWLEHHKLDNRIWFSFSRRIAEDIPQDDGTIKKITIFKHEGWIKA